MRHCCHISVLPLQQIRNFHQDVNTACVCLRGHPGVQKDRDSAVIQLSLSTAPITLPHQHLPHLFVASVHEPRIAFQAAIVLKPSTITCELPAPNFAMCSASWLLSLYKCITQSPIPWIKYATQILHHEWCVFHQRQIHIERSLGDLTVSPHIGTVVLPLSYRGSLLSSAVMFSPFFEACATECFTSIKAKVTEPVMSILVVPLFPFFDPVLVSRPSRRSLVPHTSTNVQRPLVLPSGDWWGTPSCRRPSWFSTNKHAFMRRMCCTVSITAFARFSQNQFSSTLIFLKTNSLS